MGTFTVGCLIKNHVDREKAVKIPRLMVDTGSDATWIARKLLEQIEIKAEKRRAYQMANGQQVYRDVGYAIIRVGGRETVDEVVLAESGDYMLLGARALGGLMLWVDPTKKKLIEIETQPVAKVIVPGKVPPDKDKPIVTGSIIQGRAARHRWLKRRRGKKSDGGIRWPKPRKFNCAIPQPARAAVAEELPDMHGEKMVLNMGPSHPATHGVLRIVLELDGEIITKATPDIGYLHRGDEKIAENMTYNQFIPYTDRLDYLAPLANNVAYALAVEKLMGIDRALPPRCQYIRVICCELARISSHLLGLGSFAHGCGRADGFPVHLHRAGEDLQFDRGADRARASPPPTRASADCRATCRRAGPPNAASSWRKWCSTLTKRKSC